MWTIVTVCIALMALTSGVESRAAKSLRRRRQAPPTNPNPAPPIRHQQIAMLPVDMLPPGAPVYSPLPPPPAGYPQTPFYVYTYQPAAPIQRLPYVPPRYLPAPPPPPPPPPPPAPRVVYQRPLPPPAPVPAVIPPPPPRILLRTKSWNFYYCGNIIFEYESTMVLWLSNFRQPNTEIGIPPPLRTQGFPFCLAFYCWYSVRKGLIIESRFPHFCIKEINRIGFNTWMWNF